MQAQQVAETESQQRADEATKRAADVEQQLSRLQAQLAAAERQLQEAALAKQMQTPGEPVCTHETHTAATSRACLAGSVGLRHVLMCACMCVCVCFRYA